MGFVDDQIRAYGAVRRLQRHARALGVGEPFDLERVRASVQRRRDRPLRFLPMPWVGLGPSGLWLQDPVEDVICYPADTSPLHQLHVILHEIGHIALGHRGLPRPSLPPPNGRSVWPAVATVIKYRDQPRRHVPYNDAEEYDAELFATVALSMTGLVEPAPIDTALTRAISGVRHRLVATFRRRATATILRPPR